MLLKQNFVNSDTSTIQQENQSNADVTIPLATLNKLLQDVEELKNSKTDQWHYKPYNRNKNIEIFCDSFGKHIDTRKVFGNNNETRINPCFTTSQLLQKISDKEINKETTHVLIQRGFNDLKIPGTESQVIQVTSSSVDILQEKFPKALTLVGEVLPHPSNNEMNKRVNTVNFVNQSKFPLTSQVRYVSHPVCRVENTLYDRDGIHLNKQMGAPQLMKDFFRVSQGKEPFTNLKSRDNYRR